MTVHQACFPRDAVAQIVETAVVNVVDITNKGWALQETWEVSPAAPSASPL